ncbi:MAG: 2'-5' RNA ligase family protein, partial [Actinobacteria bacterium]|nr:2'-5' RNA ligase family protein [Actinomycetota bacterium]
VTVIYPFLPPNRITENVVDEARACLTAIDAFECTFSHVAWFGQEVVWLAPDPDAPFRTLTELVWRHFPECPPYGGAHPNSIPHLTVGSTRLGELADMKRAVIDVQGKLPIRAQVDRVHLIAGANAPGSWRTVAEFALPSA